MQIGFWQILLIVLLLVLLFGRGKISDLMGDVAKGIKNFRKGMAEENPPPPPASTEPPRVIDTPMAAGAPAAASTPPGTATTSGAAPQSGVAQPPATPTGHGSGRPPG
jgi:sec-independent protein translocase protein TatA